MREQRRDQNFHFDSEYVQLRRAWRDSALTFRTQLDVLWFGYLDHLGLIADYLFQPVEIKGKLFASSFWIRDWNVFMYVLPFVEDAKDTHSHEQLLNEAITLRTRANALKSGVKVLVCFGQPDEENHYMYLLTGSEDEQNLHSLCKWKIAGVVNRHDDSAYLWMLLNEQNVLYNPISQIYGRACKCGSLSCGACKRYGYFSPSVIVGGVSGITIGRHIATCNRHRPRPWRGLHYCLEDEDGDDTPMVRER